MKRLTGITSSILLVAFAATVAWVSAVEGRAQSKVRLTAPSPKATVKRAQVKTEPKQTTTPIWRPKPTPKPVEEPVDSRSEFVKLAEELEQMQGLFSGGSGQMVFFDSQSAESQGFSRAAINLGQQLSAFSNDIMLIAEATPDGQFEKGKAKIVEERATTLLELYPELDSFFDAASQHRFEQALKPESENGNEQSMRALKIETPAGVCGGFLTPKPKNGAPWITHKTNDPNKTLKSWGYHTTPNSAGGGWTRAQTYRRDICNRNSFRDHAYTETKKIKEQKYTGWTPNGEPNPEIWNYLWPYPAWPAYVYWWHRTR